MKLTTCAASNFGSYEEIEFDFSNLGLCLIEGPTGSGKSTVLDLVCWILYGVTAKDGSVDDVKSWTGQDLLTVGHLKVMLTKGEVSIHRTRGKSNENDLYWCDTSLEHHRGKDLKETQQLIEALLCVPKDDFIASCYYSEFSPTRTFFVSKSKAQRELFESLTDLSFPIKLAESTSETKKYVKKDIILLTDQLTKYLGKKEQLYASRKSLNTSSTDWDKRQLDRIEELEVKYKNFQKEKESKIEALTLKTEGFELNRQQELARILQKIEKLGIPDEPPARGKKCSACGILSSDGKSAEYLAKLNVLEEYTNRHRQILSQGNPYKDQLAQVRTSINYYGEQITEERNKSSPFLSQIRNTTLDAAQVEKEIKTVTNEVLELEKLLSRVSTLYDASFLLRGYLLHQVTQYIENETNRCLDKYFDSELKVEFKIETSDSLSIYIQKNGYLCDYKQLSKGQRCLLNLTFSLAVMKATAAKTGIHPNLLMFDEALDGLDSDLKVKAFPMFQELQNEYESIVIIDHNAEFQNMFAKRYYVCMIEDKSTIREKDDE